jgi:DNA-binding response OmpR family regulator
MSLSMSPSNRLSTVGFSEEVVDPVVLSEEVLSEEDGEGRYAAGDIHVLVLDDDELIGNMIKEVLTARGFRVDAISDTRLIEAQLARRTYQLIVLDYVLPGLDPEQVLDWIRDTQAEASIIVVTAYPSIDSALNCLRARTFDYLTKPFQITQLQQTVTRCLESKGLLRLSPEALRQVLGSAIRKRRKAMNLTLKQMAERTKISLGYLSQIELGKNSASIETLYSISVGLGLRMSELFQAVQLSW